MNRREAIERTALALGYAVSAPALAGILNGCKPKTTVNFRPVFLSEEQAAMVGEMAELILPRTDTPGAKDAAVPAFIDVMLKEVYAKEDQDRFIAGLGEFADDAIKTYGDKFTDCEPKQQQELFRKYHDAALADKRKTNGPSPFVLMVKELTILGYFTSEAGATQALQYNPSPGPYKGCVPLSEVGKQWAT